MVRRREKRGAEKRTKGVRRREQKGCGEEKLYFGATVLINCCLSLRIVGEVNHGK